MEELKPCPFCGGYAALLAQYGKRGYFAYCACQTCNARSNTVSLGRELAKGWETTLDAQRAMNLWNRRI